MSLRLIIIKLDAIGDYLLFRNFLKDLRESAQYKNHNILLVGNCKWREIAEKYDKKYLDKFIWIDFKILRYRRFFLHRLFVLLRLNFFRAETLVHPTHSRNLYTEKFIHKIRVKNKIATSGDEVNQKPNNQYQFSNSVYDILFPALDCTHFEFFRNLSFFELLLATKLDTKLLFPNDCRLPKENLIGFFIGANSPQRRWGLLNYAQVILRLHGLMPHYKLILMGGEADQEAANVITTHVNGHCELINLAGKTTLVGLINTIRKCKLLISNETSAVHMAAALKTPAVCISNGERFGRFSPYPKEIYDKIITLYPAFSFSDPNERIKLIEQTRYESNYDIDNITVEEVVKAVMNLIDAN